MVWGASSLVRTAPFPPRTSTASGERTCASSSSSVSTSQTAVSLVSFAADQLRLEGDVGEIPELVLVEPALQRLQRIATVPVGVLIEFGVEVGVRDDNELGVDVHPDPLVEFHPALVGHVQELPEQVGVLGGVLDDREQAVALREHAVVTERLGVLPAPGVEFAEHPGHPRPNQPLFRRAVVLGVEDADPPPDVDDVVF